MTTPSTAYRTYFARGNTEPRAWADALAYMERLTECADDCSCRDCNGCGEIVRTGGILYAATRQLPN